MLGVLFGLDVVFGVLFGARRAPKFCLLDPLTLGAQSAKGTRLLPDESLGPRVLRELSFCLLGPQVPKVLREVSFCFVGLQSTKGCWGPGAAKH